MLAIDRLATTGISAWKVFMFQVAVRAHLCLFKYLSRQVPYAFTLTSPLVEPLLIYQRTRSDAYMPRIAFSLSVSKLVNFQAEWFSSFRGHLLSALWIWQTMDLCTLLVVKVSVLIMKGTVPIIEPKKFSGKKPWKIKCNSSTHPPSQSSSAWVIWKSVSLHCYRPL